MSTIEKPIIATTLGITILGGEEIMMYGGCGTMGAWSILLWIALLAIIALVLYQVLKSGRQAGAGENPLDILKTRYARGEITKEEFEAKKKDLGL